MKNLVTIDKLELDHLMSTLTEQTETMKGLLKTIDVQDTQLANARDTISHLYASIDDKTALTPPEEIERVHTEENIEEMFAGRLLEPQDKNAKMTGFKSPKHRWTAERIERLIEASKVNTLNELENNNMGFTRSAISSKLNKLGYKCDKSTGLYHKI